MEYRDSIRLLYAKDFLAEESTSVSEAAYKCGFEDVNYFSRFFKKHTGSSPTAYRGA
jgi:AraC-like DNA-binding protein